MTIDEICSACINALRAEGYNESTIFNYEGVIRRFKLYCKEYDIAIYTDGHCSVRITVHLSLGAPSLG